MAQPFSSLLPGVDQRSSFDTHSERTHSDRDTQVGLLDGGATSGGGTPLRTPLQDGLPGMPGTPLQVRLATLDSAMPAGDGTPTIGTVRPSSLAAFSRPPGSGADQRKPLSQTGLASMGLSSLAGQQQQQWQQPISQSGLASMAAPPQTGFASMPSASPASLDISFASGIPVAQSGFAPVGVASMPSASPASLDISFASGIPVAQSGLASVAPVLHSTSHASMLQGSRIVQSSGTVPLSSAAMAVASTAHAASDLLPQERAIPHSSSPRVNVAETGLASLVAKSGQEVAEFGSKVAETERGEPPVKADPFGVFEAPPSQVSLGGYEAPSEYQNAACGYEAPSEYQNAPSTVASLSPTLLGETTSFASKAPNPLGRMLRLVQDLELQKLERDVATQQEAQLQNRLELLERIAGVHAGDIDGLENLAAWHMVPGTKQGYFVDADRVPDRQAALLQQELSKTVPVAFAEVLAGKPTARGKALIQEVAQHRLQEGEHAVEDVLKTLDHNMEVMTDD